MRLYQAIAQANDKGRLGLILYTIPNFPDPKTYSATLSFLEEEDSVSIVETTIPVHQGFSDHANETIKAAHLKAAPFTPADGSLPQIRKPSLCVLYKDSIERQSFEAVMKQYRGAFDGLLLEWDEPEDAEYVETAHRHDVELVQCVGPWMSEERIATILDRALPEALVYLMSASMTGAELFDRETLERCIATVRKFRGNSVKLAAGFGIRNADDIRELQKVRGLDGVIIGTAYLKQAGQGDAAARTYVTSLKDALVRP